MAEMDPALEALQERIRAAADDRTPLRIRGGGTKDFYGGLPVGDILDTQVYAGIVEYDPTELVITARAGTSLAAVESAMRARGQMLAFEPPHFGEGSTRWAASSPAACRGRADPTRARCAISCWACGSSMAPARTCRSAAAS